MLFTVVSVIGVMFLGVLLGYWLHINRKTAYLISSGTAICGGSAIAAVGPVLKANENEMAVSLGVIFILNSIALFIFPPIGHILEMSQSQFGTWAAIAIHDTSSVVGAGEIYGEEALQLATLIKLTRALWIIPLALVTMFIFRDKTSRISIPWFIFIFVLAMVVNTYVALPEWLVDSLVWVAKRGMVVTLFLIGASLSLKSIKAVGVKPLLQAVILCHQPVVARCCNEHYRIGDESPRGINACIAYGLRRSYCRIGFLWPVVVRIFPACTRSCRKRSGGILWCAPLFFLFPVRIAWRNPVLLREPCARHSGVALRQRENDVFV